VAADLAAGILEAPDVEVLFGTFSAKADKRGQFQQWTPRQ